MFHVYIFFNSCLSSLPKYVRVLQTGLLSAIDVPAVPSVLQLDSRMLARHCLLDSEMIMSEQRHVMMERTRPKDAHIHQHLPHSASV